MMDIFVARISYSGVLLWLKRIASPGNDGCGEICVIGSNLAIVGRSADTLDFFGMPVPAGQRGELFIGSFSRSGMPVACKTSTTIGFNASAWAKECASDESGNICVLGVTTGSSTIDSTGMNGQFLLYLDSTMKVNKAFAVGGNIFHDLLVDKSNNAYVIESYSDFNPVFAVETSYLKAYSSQGTLTYSYNIPANRWGRYYDIDIDSCSNIYFTGYYRRNPQSPVPTIFQVCGQLSSDLKVNWLRIDSSFNFRSGTRILPLNTINCFVTGEFQGSIILHDTLYASGQLKTGHYNAHISAPVTIPVIASTNFFCEGMKVALTATAAGAVYWYSSLTDTSTIHIGQNYSPSALPVGNYTYFAAARTCTVFTNRIPVTVTIVPYPVISVNSGSVCSGSSFTLVPQGCLSYTYPTGSNIVAPIISTIYTVTGDNSDGCAVHATSSVHVWPSSTITITHNRPVICAGESVTLACTGATSYTWTNGPIATTFAVIPFISTVYTVTSIDDNGCVNSTEYYLSVEVCTSAGDLYNHESFYPNPTTSEINITVQKEGDLLIYDTCGRLRAKTKLEVDANRVFLDGLPPGIYLIEYGEERQVRKLVKL